MSQIWDLWYPKVIEVIESFLGNASIFTVDQCLVVFDHLNAYNYGGALVPTTTGDEGNLTSESRLIYGVGETIASFTN